MELWGSVSSSFTIFLLENEDEAIEDKKLQSYEVVQLTHRLKMNAKGYVSLNQSNLKLRLFT